MLDSTHSFIAFSSKLKKKKSHPLTYFFLLLSSNYEMLNKNLHTPGIQSPSEHWTRIPSVQLPLIELLVWPSWYKLFTWFCPFSFLGSKYHSLTHFAKTIVRILTSDHHSSKQWHHLQATETWARLQTSAGLVSLPEQLRCSYLHTLITGTPAG